MASPKETPRLTRRQAFPLIALAPFALAGAIAACTRAAPRPEVPPTATLPDPIPANQNPPIKEDQVWTGTESITAEQITSKNQLVKLKKPDLPQTSPESLTPADIKFPLPIMPQYDDVPFSVRDALAKAEVKGVERKLPLLVFRIPKGDRLTLFTAPVSGVFEYHDSIKKAVITGYTPGTLYPLYTVELNFFCAAHPLPGAYSVKVGTPILVATLSEKWPGVRKAYERREEIAKRSFWRHYDFYTQEQVKLLRYPDADVTMSIVMKETTAPLTVPLTMGNIIKVSDGKYGWYVDDSEESANKALQEIDQYNRGTLPVLPTAKPALPPSQSK